MIQASSIQQTSDGGYVMAGDTLSFDADDYYAPWVLKLDGSGNVQWQKMYGGTSGDHVSSIQQTSDGGYVMAGATHSFEGDVWVLKLNPDGTVAWQRTYGGSDTDWASSIQQTSDGGYIVAGYTDSFGAGDSAAWVLKLDGSGNVQWQKTYGGTSGEGVDSIQQTQDGGYVMAGDTYSFGAGGSEAWVLKLDGSGNVQWQKTYGSTDYDVAHSIQQTQDGGYVMAGDTYSFGTGGSEAWVLKLDTNGEIPYCGATSNATVNNTNATITNTDVIGIDTNVSPQTSIATQVLTNAAITEVCYHDTMYWKDYNGEDPVATCPTSIRIRTLIMLIKTEIH